MNELCVKRHGNGTYIGQRGNKPLPILPSIDMASNGIMLTRHFPHMQVSRSASVARSCGVDKFPRHRTNGTTTGYFRIHRTEETGGC